MDISKLSRISLIIIFVLIGLLFFTSTHAPERYITQMGDVVQKIKDGEEVYVYNDLIMVDRYRLPLDSLPELQKIATPGQIYIVGTNSFAYGTVNLIVYAIFATLLVLFILSRVAISSGSSPFNFARFQSKDKTNIPKISFNDVAGIDKIKKEITDIVDFLKNPEKYEKLGARVPRGVLLEGPPGVGKTLIAKAIAHEANVPFYFAAGAEFQELFVGVGAARIRDLFKQARDNAPAIIFIDEIDTLGMRRGSQGVHAEDSKTLTQLLTEMDGIIDSKKPIVVIGATNRADLLDPALLRPKRFDKIIHVPLPDKPARRQILAVHIKNKPIEGNVDEMLDKLASMTTGFSGADLENLINEAALIAATEGKEKIQWQHLKQAYDKITIGIGTDRRLDENTKRRVAYHETGHAINAWIVGKHIDRISILPSSRALGYVRTQEEEDKYIMTFSDLMKELIMLLGGRAAEEIFFGEPSTGAANDLERATKIAKDMVLKYGFFDLVVYENEVNAWYSEKLLHKQDVEEIVKKILQKAMQIAKDNIIKHKERFQAIAEYVLVKEIVEDKEIPDLFKDINSGGCCDALDWQKIIS